MFISRISSDNREQSTTEHLNEVAQFASRWADILIKRYPDVLVAPHAGGVD